MGTKEPEDQARPEQELSEDFLTRRARSFPSGGVGLSFHYRLPPPHSVGWRRALQLCVLILAVTLVFIVIAGGFPSAATWDERGELDLEQAIEVLADVHYYDGYDVEKPAWWGKVHWNADGTGLVGEVRPGVQVEELPIEEQREILARFMRVSATGAVRLTDRRKLALHHVSVHALRAVKVLCEAAGDADPAVAEAARIYLGHLRKRIEPYFDEKR